MKYTIILPLMVAITAAACSTDSAKTADTGSAAVSGDTTAAMSTGATATGADSGAMAAPASNTTGRIDPNSASATDLAAIPGITPDLAAAIVAGRPYSNNTGVDKVLGKSLTEQQRDSIYTRLWIPLDLNKASGDEILLIPGVGARMRHEFLEYRPWTSIEQFRREIGKYVDKDEVARLESYVKI
jgi:DNA uptake protein ComE-like DNA-binding protein